MSENDNFAVRLSLMEQRQADYYTAITKLEQEINNLRVELVDQFEAAAQGLVGVVLESVKANKEEILALHSRIASAEKTGAAQNQLLHGTIKQVENHRRLLFGDATNNSQSIAELARNSLRVAQAAEQLARESLQVARAAEESMDTLTDVVERLVVAEEQRVQQRIVVSTTIKAVMDKGPWIVAVAGFILTTLGGTWTSVIGEQDPLITLFVIGGGVAFTLFFIGMLIVLRASLKDVE